MNESAVDGRPLDATERAMLLKIFDYAEFEGSAELRSQIPLSRVINDEPIFLRLRVDRNAPRSSCADGPIPLRVFVVDPQDRDVYGELIVWIKHGYLSAIEYAWVTDETPTKLPGPNYLTFEA